jgi:LysR family transcriptional regulator, glycine cleavage system transcriptional activator
MPRRLPSLNALRAFEAAGRLGRMTLAAEELCVTHGAVSRQVRQLEQALAARLLEGPKSRLVLTEAGRALLAELTPVFDRLEAAVRRVADEEEGTLDVSCLSTMLLRWLIPRLHRFNEAHPAIEVRLSASHAPADFERHRYEVAIRMTEKPIPPAALTTELFRDDVGPVLAPALAKRLGIRKPRDLARATLLHPLTRRDAWARWGADVGWDAGERPGPEFEHFFVMIEAATAALGACIAPWPYVIDDLRTGRLVAPFGFCPSSFSYVALRRNRRSRKAEAFCEWLRREAERTPQPAA